MIRSKLCLSHEWMTWILPSQEPVFLNYFLFLIHSHSFWAPTQLKRNSAKATCPGTIDIKYIKKWSLVAAMKVKCRSHGCVVIIQNSKWLNGSEQKAITHKTLSTILSVKKFCSFFHNCNSGDDDNILVTRETALATSGLSTENCHTTWCMERQV